MLYSLDTKHIDVKALLTHGFRGKLLEDFKITSLFIRKIVFRKVNGFGRNMAIMISVFFVRAIIGGNIVPQAISSIVNSLKNLEVNIPIYGIGLFGVSAIVYISTEFILFKYFKKLAESIVTLKKSMINSIKVNGINGAPEDVIGRITSDVDFVIWNINMVLTTLLPNIFTGIVAIYTIFSFNKQVGVVTTCTLIPYLILAEYYSRKAELARFEERHEYSISIAYIRDVVYWKQENGLLDTVLNKWYKAILKVMWYDRIYWGTSLFTQFASIGIISFIALTQAYSGLIDAGSLAGILSATISAHTALLNAMWALCIQGQTTAAIKRAMVYFYGGEGYRDRVEYPIAPAMKNV